MPRRKPNAAPAGKAFDPAASVDNRVSWLEPRTQDRYCRIHKAELDETGFCRIAQAWWVPKFACPGCSGWLWDNGYCPTCTPRTQTFPGDYFEARWEASAGREYGHFVRMYRGPSPACPPAEVAGYAAELRAIAPTVGRAIGQTPTLEPAWITEDA